MNSVKRILKAIITYMLLVLIGVIPVRKIAAFALNDDFVYSEEFLLLVFIASVGILIIVYGERILNRLKAMNK